MIAILFVDWKNQHCQNDYITQGNLRFNVIPIKLPIQFLTELINLYGDTKDHK